jgi:sulfonate transport system substrate-binding protein
MSNLAESDHTSSAIKVRMGTCGQAVDYGPYHVAKSKHWFEEALRPFGAIVTYELFQSPQVITEALVNKAIDFVFEADAPAIVESASGGDGKIIFISCSLSQEILVRKDAAVSKVRDLRDKKVAVVFGSSSHYGLLRILNGAGLFQEDLSILNMITPDAKKAFEGNQIDAWAIWPPFVEQQELTGAGTAIGGGSVSIQSVLMARTKFIAEHRNLCQAVVNVLERAKRWITKYPREAQELIAEELSMPLAVVERAFPRHDWKAQLNEAVLLDIQTKADFLRSVGSIRIPVDLRSSLLDTSFAEGARPDVFTSLPQGSELPH